MLNGEIILGGGKQLQVILTGHILIEARADPLGVAHLAQNAAVGRHRNRPSPWEMGTLTTSPTYTRLSQGERLEATRVRTIRDWWRPMTL